MGSFWDTIHKAVSAVIAAALIGMFKFYVDVNTQLALLNQRVEFANEKAEEILETLDTIAPRRTNTTP